VIEAQVGTYTTWCRVVSVGRTQIYLGPDELELLDRAGLATGASRSELIRRAIRGTFGEKTKAERLLALEASAGSWGLERPPGEEYVDALRGDLNERLGRFDTR
jgi:Ribbon-helix-helix protein, copG family